MADTFFNKSDRRRATLFFTCLVIAVFVWLLTTLSGKYNYTTDTAVHYINLPGNRAFHPLQPDTVSLKIQGTGWQLLFSRMRLKPPTIAADLSKLGSHNFIEFRAQLNQINKQLRSAQRIVAIDPDTLYFDFSTPSIKKVPLKLAANLKFKKQYGVSAAITLLPGYVTITGPAAELSKIRYWPTDTLRVKNIEKPVNVKLGVSHNSNPNIELFPSAVNVTIPVNEFTEKELDIPLNVINRSTRKVTLLPSKIHVSMLSSLTGFHQPEWEKLEAVVDLNAWTGNRNSQLPVKLLNVPAFSRVVSIVPQAVDFMVSN